MTVVHSTTVIFFYVQLIACVTSQACPSGYFGTSCKYKCRCTRDMCEVNGSCLGDDTCLPGWFGPACQYADIANGQPAGHILTDGDDRTCRDYTGGTGSVTLNLPESYPFTWLRVHVNSTEAVSNLQVTFNNIVSCNNPRSAPVDGQTWDIYCSMDEFVKSVTLTGPAAASLCSIYISGGRDIAIKETAQQTNTWGKNGTDYSASLSVDGKVNQDFYGGKTCSGTFGHGSTPETWNVTFSQPRLVNRYTIYNRADNYTFRLQGFSLESFDGSTRVFKYTDSQGIRIVYTVKHGHLQMSSVKITSGSPDKVLTMCEVEIYGDSICGVGQFGRECEHKCNCDGGQPCFVSTGRCPSGCASGYHGENCSIPCDRGRYGAGCLTNCSQFCSNDTTGVRPCNRFNGTCDLGCVDGYQGAHCTLRPYNWQLIAIIVGCSLGVIIVAVIIAAGIIVCRRRQTTKSEAHGDSPAKSNDYKSLSKNEYNEIHQSLADGGYEIPDISTAETQRAAWTEPQRKIKSADMFGDACVIQSCNNSEAHAYDDSVSHMYDDGVSHTYDDGVTHTYDDGVSHTYDDGVSHAYDDGVTHMYEETGISLYEAVVDDSN